MAFVSSNRHFILNVCASMINCIQRCTGRRKRKCVIISSKQPNVETTRWPSKSERKYSTSLPTNTGLGAIPRGTGRATVYVEVEQFIIWVHKAVALGKAVFYTMYSSMSVILNVVKIIENTYITAIPRQT